MNNNQPARIDAGSSYSEHTVDTNGLRNILKAANTPSMKSRRLRKKSNVSLNNDDIDDEDDDGSMKTYEKQLKKDNSKKKRQSSSMSSH